MNPVALPVDPAAQAARRQWLGGVAGAIGLALAGPALLAGRTAQAHVDAGPVRPPVPAPRLDIRWRDGSTSTLAERLSGAVTALQTMFTACSATCPLQGALFTLVERELARRPAATSTRPDGTGPRLQLLSLSIDPMTDDPAALAQWLDRYEAGPLWTAGAPQVGQVDALLDFLRARSTGIDRHTGQVYLFNPRAELALRTVDMPPPEQVLALLDGLARVSVASRRSVASTR